MFQSEWFDEKMYAEEEKVHPSPVFKSQIDNDSIEKVLFCHWEEHCLECAPPLCYGNCPVYLERGDKKCRKVYYGIGRNKNFSGLFPYGADMRFRKWAKLTAQLYHVGLDLKKANHYDHLNVVAVNQVNLLAGAFHFIDKTRKLNGGLNFYRHKLLDKLNADPSVKFDDFLIECYSFETKPFRLQIKTNRYSEDHFRSSVTIHPGNNMVRIPVKSFKYTNDTPVGSIVINPENDIEARLVFTWLDFVKYKTKVVEKGVPLKPADKVKCVAWDLDNTMWKGVFIESTPGSLVVNPDALEAIKKFDERGVLQTVVSKNTHDEVWPFIQSLGLDQYFLYPAINWGQKSENLKKIADLLNINIDTFALIDDAPFERQEVAQALSQVRIYKDTEIKDIITYPEFDFPITEESKNRRSYYMVEQKRVQIAESFAGDYNAFLKSCMMAVTLFTPKEAGHVQRCFELIQRTNQLNLSSRKYDQAKFDQIMADDKYLKYALDVEDQFGSYGIVGFCIVEKGEDSNKILDFVISCRVAQKMIEDAFVTWLSKRMRAEGKMYLLADYVKTNRNAKILSVFEAIKFEKEDLGNDKFLLRLDLTKHELNNDVIAIHEGYLE